jgi:hypothetical protein
MPRVRAALGGTAIALLVSIIVTPNAFAAIQFLWKVSGVNLEAGETKKLENFKLTKGTLKINGTDAKNNAYEVVCTSLVKEAGSTPEIFGGQPAKSTNPLQFEGCSVAKPAGCTVKGGKIKTVNGLQGAITEGVGRSKGLVLLAIYEPPNVPFATIEIEGCAVEENNVVKGILLAEAVNPAEELKIQKFKLEPLESENSKQFGLACPTGAGLVQAGKEAGSLNRVTLEGEISVELNPSVVFGAF